MLRGGSTAERFRECVGGGVTAERFAVFLGAGGMAKSLQCV